jgi:hypothetical protein
MSAMKRHRSPRPRDGRAGQGGNSAPRGRRTVTASDQEQQDTITEAVAKISADRADIEQAKGMLRAIYGLDDAPAFDLLRWRSQETNVKLRALARQIIVDFSGLARRDALPLRSAYDNLLLTAHLRIDDRHGGVA